jgi:GT2 family glycosyltransferase
MGHHLPGQDPDDHREDPLRSRDVTDPVPSGRVSVVIMTHNRRKKVIRTINSVLPSEPPGVLLEIVIVDDASRDGTSDAIKREFTGSIIKVIVNDSEKMVSESRNRGLEESRGDYVLFLDDDVVLKRDTVTGLIEYLSGDSEAVCAMPIILYHDRADIIWCAGVLHSLWTTLGRFRGFNQTYRGQSSIPLSTDSVITAFMVKREVATRIRFDAEAFPIGWEDMDYAMQLKAAGHDLVVLPWVTVLHDFPVARFVKNRMRLHYEIRNRLLFHRKWCGPRAQRVCALSFSMAIGLGYLLAHMLHSRELVDPVRTASRALLDGLTIPVGHRA